MSVWDKSLIELQEQVYVIYLNEANQVISWKNLNTGTCNETMFDIKLALGCALNCMAAKLVIAHNHPSFMLKPSYADIKVTERLYKAADLLEIKLIDHLILNRQLYYSFTDHGLLKA